MKKLLITFSFVAAAACDSSGSESSQFKVLSANENAISLRVAMPGYSDGGYGLALDHCAKYNKVASLESSGGNGYRGVFTYLCN